MQMTPEQSLKLLDDIAADTALKRKEHGIVIAAHQTLKDQLQLVEKLQLELAEKQPQPKEDKE